MTTTFKAVHEANLKRFVVLLNSKCISSIDYTLSKNTSCMLYNILVKNIRTIFDFSVISLRYLMYN